MKSKEVVFPVRVEKGNSRVTIYHHKNGGYSEFRVAYFHQGQRKMKSFSTFEDAKAKAEEINDSVNSGELEALSLSRSQVQEYTHALGMLEGSGLNLIGALSQLIEAKKLMGDKASLIEAAQFYNTRHRAIISKPVAEIIQEFEQTKLHRGICVHFFKQTQSLLKRFLETFNCDLASVKSIDLIRFMNTPSDLAAKRNKLSFVGPVTFNGRRERLAAFFKFAVRKKYLPADMNPIDDIDLKKRPGGHIEIWTPGEIVRLFSACPHSETNRNPHAKPWPGRGTELLRPVLALGAFAGMRTSEILKLRWEQVGVGSGGKYIEVKAQNAKTRTRRLIPMSDNLKAWLAPCAKPEGCIYPYSGSALVFCLARLAEKAGLSWRHNALRHSYISYRVAQIQDVSKVSLEAGNSPAMVFRHYRELVTPEAAAEWFALMPSEASEKITYLKTA